MRIGVCGSWLAAFTFFACSSSSDSNGGSGTSCSAVTGCGGDIVGTWKVQSVCEGVGTAEISFCPSATVDTGGLTMTGTFTFGADASYTTALVLGGSLRYTLPSSCLTMDGETFSCADLGSGVMASAGDTFSAASCAQSGANCVCTFSLTPETSTTTGTYTTSGTSVTLTSAGEIAQTAAYCATGTDLSISSPSMAMDSGMMGTTTVSENIFATKQ